MDWEFVVFVFFIITIFLTIKFCRLVKAVETIAEKLSGEANVKEENSDTRAL